MAWLAAAESMKLIARFALNLNLSTFASGAFAKFEARFGAQLRGRMVIEIDKSDLLANLPRFAAVQESLHAHGHLLCIDGLTGPDLAAIDYGRLSADYYKVGWHPDFFAEDGEGRVGLERLAAQASVEEAVKFGQELGLSLFQGWYLDSLLGSFRSSRFKLVANS